MTDLSSIFTNMGTSSQDSAWTWNNNQSATTTTIFNPETGLSPPEPTPQEQAATDDTQQPGILGAIGNAAQKSSKSLVGSGNRALDKSYGFNSVPRELYSRGFDNPTERAQPVNRSRPAQVENPREIWRQWYNDMKTFANTK